MRRLALVMSIAATGWLMAGAEASAQVRGSFARTCTQIEQRGPFLRAFCADVRGRLVPSRIDLRACPSGRVSNVNGQLACEGYGRRRYREYDEDFGGYEEYRRRPSWGQDVY